MSFDMSLNLVQIVINDTANHDCPNKNIKKYDLCQYIVSCLSFEGLNKIGHRLTD